MATTDPIAFMDRLNRSGLLDADRLEQVLRLLLPGCPSAEALARALVAHGWLTAGQARDLLAGPAPAPGRGFPWGWLAAALLLTAASVGLTLLALPRPAPPEGGPVAQKTDRAPEPGGVGGKVRRPASRSPIPRIAPPAPNPETMERASINSDVFPPLTAQRNGPLRMPLGDQQEDFSPVNLLVNGSFEQGPEFNEWGTPLDVGSRLIPGWTVTRDQIDYVAAYWTAADGRRSLDLNGSPGGGGVEQTFRTKPGQRYRVTFALAGNPTGEEQGVMRLGVSAAGATQEFEFDTAGKSQDDMGWIDVNWEFVAAAEETTLEFYSLDTTDPYRGPALDDVRVVAAPGGG